MHLACISQHLDTSVTALLSCDTGNLGRTQLDSGDEICCCHIYLFTILLFTIYYLLRFDKEGLLVNPFLYSLFVQMI